MTSSAIRRLRSGDAAPVFEVQGSDGPVGLDTLWAEGPLLLVFLRHFG